MNDMGRVIQTLKKNKGEAFVMATVIRVVGSAYRHEGAKMVIGQDGRSYGMVSGGCLEEDLRHHAKEVFEEKVSKLVTYDLKQEDDLLWGRGLGCNGTVDILLESVQWSEKWKQMELWLMEGKRVVSITTVEGDNQSKTFWDESHILYHGYKELQDWMKSLWKVKWKGNQVYECYLPKDHLYIFGAGPDAEPLVELASQLDFVVRIIDPRENRCCPSYFPKADQCIVEHPRAFLTHHLLPPQSYVIIMTHSFGWDQQIIQHFSQHPPRYLGILGPRQRTKRLLGNQEIPGWIHSPIGLNIQAEGPEEISVSIAAELLKVRNSATLASL